jgi:hypothetical protein
VGNGYSHLHFSNNAEGLIPSDLHFVRQKVSNRQLLVRNEKQTKNLISTCFFFFFFNPAKFGSAPSVAAAQIKQ